MGFNYKKYPFSGENPPLDLVNLFTDNMNANIFVVDSDGDIIYANCRSAETYECTMDELFDFNAHTMQEKGYTDRMPAVKEVLDTRKEVKRYIKTGKHVGMIIYCKPILDEAGKVKYAVATSYKEEEFLDLFNKLDSEKNKLRSTVTYLNKLSQPTLFLNSSNAKMRHLYDLANKAAVSDSVVMVYGASGTGKEVMANYIHSNSNRKNEPFIPINCAAIPAELMESEFFGYEKGSFTGANEKGKLGLFDIASNGTLFLDEIGELSLSMQSKLLRVLESGEYMRIGSNKITKTNARIIGATNKELFQLVEEGGFRRDLYYRLNVIPIHLPSLKDRPEDILPLAYSFLDTFNQKMGTKKEFSQSCLRFFQNYSWPGNIRELRNMVERLVVISDSNVINISKDYVSNMVHRGEINPKVQDEPEASQVLSEEDYSLPFKEALHNFEQDYVNHVLQRCGGNVSKAAKELGLHRSSLYNILNR